jgi:hypothetical protein
MESWLREEELEWTPRPVPRARPERRRSRQGSRRRTKRGRTFVLAWALVAAAAVALPVLALGHDEPKSTPSAGVGLEIAMLVGSLDHQHRLLAAIEHCESRGLPGVVSPDGRYGGLYQFDVTTWRAMGGAGDPASAPVPEQRLRAQRLLQLRGIAPWPRCGPLAAARIR